MDLCPGPTSPVVRYLNSRTVELVAAATRAGSVTAGRRRVLSDPEDFSGVSGSIQPRDQPFKRLIVIQDPMVLDGDPVASILDQGQPECFLSGNWLNYRHLKRSLRGLAAISTRACFLEALAIYATLADIAAFEPR